MVETLRKQDRNWRFGRWMVLVSGIFSAGLCIAIFCLVVPRIQSKSEDISSAEFMLSFSFPIILLFAGTASMCLTLVIRDWHGNTTRTLLIKLLDEQQERGIPDDKAV